MVKIAEINSQNPWWNQGEGFIIYDQNLMRAEPIFFNRKRISPLKQYILLSKDDVSFQENMVMLPTDVFLALLPCSIRNL
jgi:hypothetical protein